MAECAALVRPTLARDAFSVYPKIPHPMWINLHPFRDQISQNIVVASFGLSKFVGREIEMHAPERMAKTLIERVSGLITYLLQNGSIISEGDTIAVSKTEKISVRLVQSEHFAGAPVFMAMLEAI